MTEVCSDYRYEANLVLLKDCYLYVMHRKPKKGLNYKIIGERQIGFKTKGNSNE